MQNSNSERLTRQLAENIARKSLTVHEQKEAIKRLLKLSQSSLEKSTGGRPKDPDSYEGIAKNIGRMWEMLNHGRTYEQKMKEMNKMFGMKERNIQDYLNVYKLSTEINLQHRDAVTMDTNTLAGLGVENKESGWSKTDKKEAIEVLR